MDAIPEQVAALLRERDQARAAKDYARSDELRDRIGALGFTVRDTPQGGVAEPKPTFDAVDPAGLPDTLDEPAACAISIHVLYEGFRDDLSRFVNSVARHCADHDYEIVVTECGSPDGEWIESLAGERVRVLHLSSDPGWATGRNAAIGASRGAIVAVADLSVEATGDLLGPVISALQDPRVGLAGPWGLRTRNLRDFEEVEGPEVAHAIQGYFLATRRDIAREHRFDRKFSWYRHADIDLSFQIRSAGYRAVATEPAATRHTHRAWMAIEEDERARRSKRNFYRFLDRFKDRTDLIDTGV